MYVLGGGVQTAAVEEEPGCDVSNRFGRNVQKPARSLSRRVLKYHNHFIVSRATDISGGRLSATHNTCNM